MSALRSIASGVRGFFATEKPEAPPMGEVAWADSRIYSARDFPKYNPDDLIGRKGAAIYRKMMLDEQVKAVVKFRRDAITARSWFFQLDDEALGEEESERRIAICERIVSEMKGSFRDALNGVMAGMINGFSLTEKVYGQIEHEGKTWWGLERLKARPAHTFQFHTDKHGNIEKIVQRVGGQEIEIDAARFIHYVQNPDIDEHYGQSELREAYRDWFSKDMVIKFWNIWMERHAAGFIILKPDGSRNITEGSAELATLKEMMANINSKTWLLLPNGIDLETKHPQTKVAYDERIARCDKGIGKALLVPNLLGLSEQGQTGSYSQSQTQLEAFLMSLEADAGRLEETLDEQLWRDLGDLNWGDGIYPKFKFKPASVELLERLIKSWKDAVAAGSVVPSDTDEEHLRDMMGFPPRGEPLKVSPQGPGQQPGGAAPEAPGSEGPEVEPPADAPGEESVSAQANITISGLSRAALSNINARAFTRAARRVDFAVIDKRAGDLEATGVDAASAAMGRAVIALAAIVRGKQLGQIDGDVEAIGALSFAAKDVTRLRKGLRQMLEEGWGLGRRHARDEIAKARRGAEFAQRIDMAGIEDAAAAFFDSKSFAMAGKLSEDALATIRNILSKGIKTTATTEEMVEEIYTELSRKGMLGAEAQEAIADDLDEPARERLRRVLETVNPDARLVNVVRTNLFEAVNEARYSFFADPELEGYVEAQEYSAILDGRTTAICRELDGKVYEMDSEYWTGRPNYRPPNHFQCRSVLIAVTRDDAWEASDGPAVEPQDGFG